MSKINDGTIKNSAKQLDESYSVDLEELIKIKENDIRRGEAFKRLAQNPDFIYLIKEEFFVKEAANAVKVLDSENAYNNDKLRLMNDAKMVAISGLQRWFNNVVVAAENAKSDLEEYYKILEEDTE